MAHIKKLNTNKNTGITTYKIQSKCREIKTGKYIYKCLTFHKPPDMSEYTAKRELAKLGYELDMKVKEEASGIIAKHDAYKLTDYIDDWLNHNKLVNGDLYVYSHLTHIKIIRQYFGQVLLSDISPSLIQNFRDSLLKHIIIHESAKLKMDKKEELKSIMKNQKFRIKKMKETIGISHACFENCERGKTILYETATKLCDKIGINVDEFFDKIITSRNYSRTTIKHIMSTLNVILSEAKRERFIEHNFASSEYITPLKRIKKEVVILDDDEARQLKKTLDEETDIVKKTAIYIILLTGIRRGELCGLEWSDIRGNQLSIRRAVRELPKFGMKTKQPKSSASIRTIYLPQTLISVLKEYKIWYDKQKEAFGESWTTDRLIVSENGRVLRPDCYRKWLKHFLKKANLKQVTLHSLRHTNITMQLAAGVDLKTVSSRAGHQNFIITNQYSHFLRNSDFHASEIIDDIFNK